MTLCIEKKKKKIEISPQLEEAFKPTTLELNKSSVVGRLGGDNVTVGLMVML